MDIRDLVWNNLYRAESAKNYYAEKARQYRKLKWLSEWPSLAVTLAVFFLVKDLDTLPFLTSGGLTAFLGGMFYQYSSSRLSVYITAQTFQRSIAERYSSIHERYEKGLEMDDDATEAAIEQLEQEQMRLNAYIVQYFPYTDKKVAEQAEATTRRRYFGDELQGEGGH